VLARALRFLGKNAIPRRWRNDAGYLEPAGRLSDLAEDLFARFEQEGTAADLDAAIDATQQAADLTPSRHPSRAVHLSNLGAACLARFELTGRATDLETAIRVGMQAIDLTPQDHPSRAGRLSNLANALRARFGQAACAMTDGRPDLAVELLEQGRSVLWTQVLTMRGDLSRLAENARAWPNASTPSGLDSTVRYLGRKSAATQGPGWMNHGSFGMNDFQGRGHRRTRQPWLRRRQDNGRKRHIVTDTLGLLIVVVVLAVINAGTGPTSHDRASTMR
jgi:hypothetical protein